MYSWLVLRETKKETDLSENPSTNIHERGGLFGEANDTVGKHTDKPALDPNGITSWSLRSQKKIML